MTLNKKHFALGPFSSKILHLTAPTLLNRTLCVSHSKAFSRSERISSCASVCGRASGAVRKALSEDLTTAAGVENLRFPPRTSASFVYAQTVIGRLCYPVSRRLRFLWLVQSLTVFQFAVQEHDHAWNTSVQVHFGVRGAPHIQSSGVD